MDDEAVRRGRREEPNRHEIRSADGVGALLAPIPRVVRDGTEAEHEMLAVLRREGAIRIDLPRAPAAALGLVLRAQQAARAALDILQAVDRDAEIAVGLKAHVLTVGEAERGGGAEVGQLRRGAVPTSGTGG